VKTFITLSLGLALLAIGLVAARPGGHTGGEAQRVLEFDTMYAVDGPFTSPANKINGVRGDELPWVLESARGTLLSDGHLEVRVQGLVFADDDSVPPELQGKNDERTFRVLLTCITENGAHKTRQAEVWSRPFAATEDGDAELDTEIELPVPCVAPVLFVMSGSEDAWFAVTGFERGED
jgi:hypothetical protein